MRTIGLFLFLISLTSCSTTEPPDSPEPVLKLELEDVSCTEAWITLTASNLQLPTTITLKQNEETIETINLSTNDSLLYIDSLLPNFTYNFQAIGQSTIQSFSQTELRSNELSVTTMDTTSHNFTWQTWTFGEHSSSALYDVAIVGDEIWAVGEIYMYDSLGRADPNAYNAVHWDGYDWELLRVYFPTVCGSTSLTAYPAKAIFIFDDGQIWISSTGDKIVILKDGLQINQFCLPTTVAMSINKLWGSSSSDLYAVGNAGNIAYWNGVKWTKIESGTTTDINDIWGFIDPNTQEREIYCAVSFLFQSGDRKILHIKNNIVDSLSWMGDKRINSIWTKNNIFFYTAGDGVFEDKRGFWNQVTDIPPYYSQNIRGNDVNDIYICGDFGLFAHYNGVTWQTYNELFIQGIYFSLGNKNNTVVTIGIKGSQAVIVIGKRN